MKTIDITPSWEQWLNFIMAIALRSKDPAKVLEPLSEDFKNMATCADLYTQAIPKIKAAIDLIEYLTEKGETSDLVKDLKKLLP